MTCLRMGGLQRCDFKLGDTEHKKTIWVPARDEEAISGIHPL
ncbi:MAG: hypothetical protein OXU68_04725 [Bacteroidota bacterium]|nr:hypothetical protein [Bacteroidota bacterium]